jgi:hypothetical protein
MIRLYKARLKVARSNDEGIAIVMVLGISMVLMILLTVALSVSLSAMTTSKTDESWNGAIAAAYAGIEDYKSKIANDNSYYRYGNSAAPFSAGSSLSAPPTVNVAFGAGTSGTWASIPTDRAGGPTAFYRYEVDSRDYLTTGILKIRATGRVGNVTRSVVANLKQKGFIDFLYYTDYEIGDPDLLTGKTATQKAACVKYAYAGRASGCGSIAFGANDVINGPMHTNDQFRACGATFNGAVTTAYRPATATADAYLHATATGTCGTSVVEKFPKGKPVSVGTLDLPPTNKKMFDEVRTDIPAEVPRPGCLYTGPTKIVFNNNGTMTVRSPWTKVTRVSNAAGTIGTTNNADCGAVGTADGQLGSANGATIPVPARNLVFVQDVEFVTGNVTALMPQWKTGTYPKKTATVDYTASDCNAGNFIGYPLSNESVSATIATAYNCKKGDVFVEGTVNGEVTVNADNYAYVTGDIQYSTDPAAVDSVLGLIAQNQVWVWNPIKSNGDLIYTGDRRIDAAMLSVLKTFQVQNYDSGTYRGKLNVTGAIAQKFRGPVGLGNTTATTSGFSKNYNYDERFLYIAPPKFLSPVSTTYGITTVVEVKTAYKPDGSTS